MTRFVPLLAILLLAACDGGAPADDDAGTPPVLDGGGGEDAGAAPNEDAGTHEVDAGDPPRADAGGEEDAGPGPGLSLTFDADVLTAVGGTTQSFPFAITRTGGASGAVALTLMDLPDGVSSNDPIVPAGETEGVLELTASLEVTFATTQVAIALRADDTDALIDGVGLVVQEAATIDITYSPDPVTVPQLGENTLTATAVRNGGFSGVITIELTELPAGVVATPNPFTVPRLETVGTTTLSATDGAALGPATITATSAIPIRDRVDAVDIEVVPPPSFEIALAAESVTLVQDTDATVEVTVTRDPGFTDAVTVGATPEPEGVGVEPVTIAAGETTGLLTFEAALDARIIVPTSVTVEAMGGGSIRTAPLDVVVTPESPNDFDATFGDEGLRFRREMSFDDFIGIALDGTDIVVGGTIGRIYRYTDAGVLDSTFGTAGEFDAGLFISWRSVAVDSAGRIIACGDTSSGGSRTAQVVRVTSAGVADSTFGTSGIASFDLGGDYADFGGCTVDSLDRVLFAGVADDGTNPTEAAIVRLTTAGVLDATFGTGGSLTFGVGAADTRSGGVAVDGSDRVLLTGSESTVGPPDAWVARVTTAGVLDTTFDTDGIVELPASTSSGVAVGITAGDDVAVIGFADFPDSFAARLSDVDGSLVTSYGTAGVALFGDRDSVNAAVFDPDGTITFALNAGLDEAWAIGRLDASGTPDLTFGPSGLRTTAFGDPRRRPAGIAIDGSDRILVTGNSDRWGVLARYLP
jgi:uncharacterized delta-60 repeat protein